MESNRYDALEQVSSSDAGQIFRDHLRGCVRASVDVRDSVTTLAWRSPIALPLYAGDRKPPPASPEIDVRVGDDN